MADNQSKASKEGYAAGKSGKSADSNPYKNDTPSGRMFDIVGDVITGNAANRTQENDKNSKDWSSAHGAGGKDKGQK
jgi:hypothetical protein